MLAEQEILLKNLRFIKISAPCGHIYNCRTPRLNDTFIYVRCGKLIFESEEKKTEASEGDIFFIPQKSIVSTKYIGAQNEAMILNFDIVCGKISQFPEIFRKNGESPLSFEISELFEKLASDSLSGNSSSFLYMSYIYRLMHLLSADRKIPRRFERIIPALRRIERNPAESLTVSEYASMCYMSQTGFRRLFAEYTGKSPIEYRNTLRLRIAEKLILEGKSTAQASAEAGFSSISFYYRLLRRKQGFSEE